MHLMLIFHIKRQLIVVLIKGIVEKELWLHLNIINGLILGTNTLFYKWSYN